MKMIPIQWSADSSHLDSSMVANLGRVIRSWMNKERFVNTIASLWTETRSFSSVLLWWSLSCQLYTKILFQYHYVCFIIFTMYFRKFEKNKYIFGYKISNSKTIKYNNNSYYYSLLTEKTHLKNNLYFICKNITCGI